MATRMPALTPHIQRARRVMPAVAFFGGFLWDAITIGRKVGTMDLWMLTGYLLTAAGILWFLGRREALASQQATLDAGAGIESASAIAIQTTAVQPWWRESGPYLLLQFCFGGLFSALFIFYFKSSGHFLTLLLALGLGGVLIANEFLEDRYRRFTLTWALFGLCAMLLLNFVIPHVLGSIAPIWFLLSTLTGAALTQGLRWKTPGQPGQIKPVWGIAAGLLLAYWIGAIPPVPLVTRDIAVGHALERTAGDYRLQQERTPWWLFWRKTEREIHLVTGERLYCVSAIFAPRGLSTRLVHHWQFHDATSGWQTRSRIGFGLAGGRHGGYRGYSYKQNLTPGAWRVAVETEDGRTVAVHHFKLSNTPRAPDAAMWIQTL